MFYERESGGLGPPVALCASPMAPIVPAPQGRPYVLTKELSVLRMLSTRPSCACQSPPVSGKAINAIFRLLSSRLGVGESFLYFGTGLGDGCCNCRSIAHTKPASSRTTAMIAVGDALPRSIRCR